MKWYYQSTERNSTGVESFNAGFSISAQENQLEKIPPPPHSDAPLSHANSHVLGTPPAVIPWFFYPWFGRRVAVLRFKKFGRPRRYTKTKPFPTNAKHAVNLHNPHPIMSSPVVFPLGEQSGKSNSAKSESSEEYEYSVTKESSETDDGLQDDRSTGLKGSANASVASSNADAEKGRENESDVFPPQMPETLEDLSNDRKPTPTSDPKESAESQVNSNFGDPRGNRRALQ